MKTGCIITKNSIHIKMTHIIAEQYMRGQIIKIYMADVIDNTIRNLEEQI